MTPYTALHTIAVVAAALWLAAQLFVAVAAARRGDVVRLRQSSAFIAGMGLLLSGQLSRGRPGWEAVSVLCTLAGSLTLIAWFFRNERAAKNKH